MTQSALFETRTPEQIAEERRGCLDEQVANLLLGKTPFCITEHQRRLLHILAKRYGRDRAISIGELKQRLEISERAIKDMVRSLVTDFFLPVGASRNGSDGGYYLVMTAEEARSTAQPYIDEALKLLKRASVLVGHRAILELRGQLAITEETRHWEVQDGHV
jgi:hypothetical protein